MEETRKIMNPLRIYCKNCGAPAGFDIIRQTYSCPNCGQVSGLPEVEKSMTQWRELHKKNMKARTEGQQLEEHACPTCGAQVIIKAGEATGACDFCGSKLVRKDLINPEQLPELIIPFFITPEEAKKRMQQWAQDNAKTPEGEAVLANIDKFKGYYLPYQLVRGPVGGTVTRDETYRQYYCDGYLDGTAVNTSKQLDNLTLNDMEPFDWSEARPFEYGYIAGQNVKLADISGAQTEERILREVKEDFLPEVERVMQTEGVNINLKSGNLLTIPVLLPVYFIKAKFKDRGLTAVMNGQTGRIAVSTGREKRSKPWLWNWFLYTLGTFLLLTFLFGNVYMGLMCTSVPFIVYGVMFSQSGDEVVRRIVLKTEAAKAERKGNALSIAEGEEVLENPYDNTPVFREKNDAGELVPVHLRFYPLSRMISVVANTLITIFLPAIIAAVIRLADMKDGERFMDGFAPEYGAAWYTLVFIIVLLYLSKGLRMDAYDHPYIYEILENGKEKLIGDSDSRKLTVLSMFGVGQKDDQGEKWGLIKMLWMMGGVGLFLGGTFLFILIGSVAAILN